MWLSLITAGIYVANAAGFLLLRPGPELLEYVACSSIYSLAIWINLWIVPASHRYQTDRLSRIRQLQLMISIIAIILLLLTHPSAIALAFAALLLLETAMFYSYPLLFNSATSKTQRIELARAVLGTISLIVVVLFLEGAPRWHSILLLVLGTGLAVALAAIRYYAPPSLALARLSSETLTHDIARAFGNQQLHALLGARVIEVSAILLLSHLAMLGAIIALKIGLSIANAMCMNVRRASSKVLLVALALSYTGASAAALALARLDIPFVPMTLKLLTITDCLIAFPVVMAFLGLALFGMRASRNDTTVGAPAE